MSDDVAAIRALNEAYADAVNRRDPQAWAATWAVDATWDLMGTVVTGREAIVGLWQGAMAGYRFVGFFCQTGPIVVAGDTANATVWTHEVLETSDGTTSRPLGRYDDEYVRTPGGWRFGRRVFHIRKG